MSELRVVAQISSKPGSEEAVREILGVLARATNEEEGCAEYLLFESAEKPGTFFTVENWDGHESLDAHMQTAHVAAALTAAGEHITELNIHPLTPVHN